MPLANIVKFLNCLVCALLGLSYLSPSAFATTSQDETTEPSRQVVIACNTRNLERFLSTASTDLAAQQFEAIRQRVLTY